MISLEEVFLLFGLHVAKVGDKISIAGIGKSLAKRERGRGRERVRENVTSLFELGLPEEATVGEFFVANGKKDSSQKSFGLANIVGLQPLSSCSC